MADDKMASLPTGFVGDNALVSAVRNTYLSLLARRDALGLSNPGTFENINREVSRDVSLNNFMFTGLRAEWNKPISNNPIFQLSHQLSMGAQGMSPYTFSALYGSNRVFLQGTMENDGSLVARSNYRWNNSLVTKTNAQIQSGQSMLSIENDYSGKDFTASLKGMNPNIIEGGLKGIFIASYLQSVTPSLALGLEAVWQRVAMNSSPEALLSYGARYKGSDWIASLQMQTEGPQGSGISSSFWRKLTDKVSVGTDLNLQFAPGLSGQGGLMGGGLQKEGSASAGAKYEFRASTFRAQVDSKGRLSCLLEKTILPAVRVTFAGEMDHLKQQAKIGVGVSVEATSEDLMEQMEKGTVQAPSVPF
ncbi:MAG: hypothetical protein LQ338_003005 [Usnochroma carphineum]|nr:MAG: hypothetical protein LQ338_003005 [Usnochroma carphineum]